MLLCMPIGTAVLDTAMAFKHLKSVEVSPSEKGLMALHFSSDEWSMQENPQSESMVCPNISDVQ